MFSSEIKETIYIAIACMTAALVLGLVAFVLHIRTDIATSTNMNISAQTSMAAYNKLNKYQDNILYGEDVIACIREFAGSDIIVYIDDLEDDSGAKIDYYLDKQSNIDYSDMASIKYLEYGYSSGMDVASTNRLSNGVKRNATYFSYLVFDEYVKSGITAATFKEATKDLSYGEVTAIVIKRVGDGRHDWVETTSTDPTDSELQNKCGCKSFSGNDSRYQEIYGTPSCTAHQIYKNIKSLKS